MRKVILIFMGWASPINLYNPFKYRGYEILYVDINNYNDIYLDKNTDISIISWSMGTLMALEFMNKHNNISRSVFISPTLNFTLTTPKVVIKKMIRGLKTKREETILNFLKLNFYKITAYNKYIQQYLADIEKIDLDTLIKGLKYLKETDLTEINVNKQHFSLIIVSKDDKIIPIENSNMFIEKITNHKIIKVDCIGHNVIYEGNILNYIDKYFKGE